MFIFSVGSSNSSHSNSRDQTHRDERLETHLEADQSEDENEFIENDYKGGYTQEKNTLILFCIHYYIIFPILKYAELCMKLILKFKFPPIFLGGSRRLSGHGKQRHMGLQITHV